VAEKYGPQKAWKKRNWKRTLAINMKQKTNRRQHFRALLLTEFGPCVRCGYDDRRALQFDHVQAGGNKERTVNGKDWVSPFTEPMYVATRDRFVAGELQVLCANCNWIKRYEQNEHGTRGTI